MAPIAETKCLFLATALLGATALTPACDDAKHESAQLYDEHEPVSAPEVPVSKTKSSGTPKERRATKPTKKGAPDGRLVILASHAHAKPDDPVKVTFSGIKVIKADFDPKSPAGNL